MEKTSENDIAGPYKSEFWGICCESGKRYSQVVRKKFRVSMAALDPTVVNTSPCVSLLVERGGSEYLLCNLKPDAILQVNLNLLFDKNEKITFFLKGHGTVHLSGYHMLSANDVSELEAKTKPPSPGKKPNAVLAKKGQASKLTPKHQVKKKEVSDEDEESSDDEDESDEKSAKPPSPVKKLNAVLAKKGQASKLTPKHQMKKKEVSDLEEDEESSDDDDEDDNDDDDVDEESDEKSGADLKALRNYAAGFTKKRQLSTGEEESSDEEESSEDDSDDDDDDDFEVNQTLQNKEKNAQLKQKINEFMSKKRLKMESSTPPPPPGNKKKSDQKIRKSPNLPPPPPLFPTEVIDLEESDSKTQKKSFNTSELNSSIGRTPMPKKSLSTLTQLNSLNSSLEIKKPKNKSSANEGNSSDSADDSNEKKQQVDTPTKSPELKKKKKKKNKLAANESQIESTPNKANENLGNVKTGKKLPGGIEYEDIRIGNGPEARKGKLVHVYYTGKLDNSKVFDSRQPGSKPFSFKLGTGQVIKGWDFGLEGMKVGGKRRLKIPPHMGYKNQRMGDIPPNSTLHFVVELKAVS